MLWFRSGVVITACITLSMSILVLISVVIMCTNPSNGRAMNADPYYNGWLGFYLIVIFAEFLMAASSGFGLMLAFRVWRNNNQLDHRLRHLFSLWLAVLCVSSLFVFVMGILGLVRYREPQEEIMSLYEIFAKYNQDVKFVGSFERYQRENSCCGINGPDDWMMAQFKQGGGSSMGGMSGGGGFDSYMGSPSTGKCHLTPPTIPMGCGKKLLEDIHWTMTVYAAVLIFETLTGAATATLGWYCFFYWIEKEVIIIPEDEVSNLIVIEPESSGSTLYSTVTDYSAMADWSRSHLSSTNGTQYSGSRPGSQSYYGSGSGSRSRASANPYYESGYGSGRGPSGSFQPNTPRPSRFSKVSNFYGAIPSIGGPHSAFLSMQMIDPNDEAEKTNQNLVSQQRIIRSASQAANGVPPRQSQGPPPQTSEEVRLHQGQFGKSVVYVAGQSQYGSRYTGPGSQFMPKSGTQYGSGTRASGYGSGGTGGSYATGYATAATGYGSGTGTLASQSGHHHREKPTKLVKKEKSKNHILHKQEKALGGKVLVEMHVDHSRDPDKMPSNMSTSHLRKGHRAHHATIALIKNRHPPKKQEIFHGPEKGHGQTGHLATDILAMSGGAGAAKSMIDDVCLRVEHDPSLTDGHHEGYLHKLQKKKKNQDHPDKDHPGHGPVEEHGGVLAAPSADGSQAQLLIDGLFDPPPPPKKSSSEVPIIKPHEPDAEPGEEEDNNNVPVGSHHSGHHDHHGAHSKHHHDHHGHHSHHDHHDHHGHHSHHGHGHSHHDHHHGHHDNHSHGGHSAHHAHHGHHEHSHGGHSHHGHHEHSHGGHSHHGHHEHSHGGHSHHGHHDHSHGGHSAHHAHHHEGHHHEGHHHEGHHHDHHGHHHDNHSHGGHHEGHHHDHHHHSGHHEHHGGHHGGHHEHGHHSGHHEHHAHHHPGTHHGHQSQFYRESILYMGPPPPPGPMGFGTVPVPPPVDPQTEVLFMSDKPME